MGGAGKRGAGDGPRWLRRALVLACGLAPISARAEEPGGIELDWTAPAECPDRAEEIASIQKRLRASTTRASAFRARAGITHEEGGFRVRIETDAGGVLHERSVDGERCEDVAEAAALIIALAIDPGVAPKAPPSAPSPAPVPVAPPPAREVDRAPSIARQPVALRGTVGVFGALDAAALPAPAPGVGGALGLEVGRGRLAAYAAYFPRQRATVSGTGSGGDVGLALGGLAACFAFLRSGALSLHGCLEFEAGALSGEGFGVIVPGSGRALWLAPGAGFGGKLALSSALRLVLSFDALVPVSHRGFELSGLDEVYRPPFVTARTALGLEVSFP